MWVTPSMRARSSATHMQQHIQQHQPATPFTHLHRLLHKLALHVQILKLPLKLQAERREGGHMMAAARRCRAALLHRIE